MKLKIKNMNVFKMILDIIIAVLLVLMYNAKVINLSFHEIGGLFVSFMVLVHIVINWKWVVSVSKKIFSKGLSFKLRFGYIINFLLLISMLLVMISGILISKVVFAGLSFRGGNWQVIHYASAASLLILVGIHLGLHWGFVMSMFKRFIKIPAKVSRPICIVLTLAIVAFGFYSMYSTNFRMWISAPFTAGDMSKGQFRGDFNRDNIQPQSDISSGNHDTVNSDAPEANKDFSGSPDGDFRDQGKRFGKGMESGGHGGGTSGILNVLLSYTSIIGAFAAITYYCETLLRRRRKSHLLIQQLN